MFRLVRVVIAAEQTYGNARIDPAPRVDSRHLHLYVPCLTHHYDVGGPRRGGIGPPACHPALSQHLLGHRLVGSAGYWWCRHPGVNGKGPTHHPPPTLPPTSTSRKDPRTPSQVHQRWWHGPRSPVPVYKLKRGGSASGLQPEPVGGPWVQEPLVHAPIELATTHQPTTIFNMV